MTPMQEIVDAWESGDPSIDFNTWLIRNIDSLLIKEKEFILDVVKDGYLDGAHYGKKDINELEDYSKQYYEHLIKNKS